MFERVRNLGFINRFGEEMVRARRCYRYRDRARGVAPLDIKVGIDGCFEFSPLLYTQFCQRTFWPRLDTIVGLDLPLRLCA